MLDRNKRIKPRPERFQNCKDLFDLILTCEERVYDQVVEGESAQSLVCQHSREKGRQVRPQALGASDVPLTHMDIWRTACEEYAEDGFLNLWPCALRCVAYLLGLPFYGNGKFCWCQRGWHSMAWSGVCCFPRLLH